MAPESVEVQMFPPLLTTAASLVPSLDEVIDHQICAPVEVFSVHVLPESVEVQMFPW